jgi:hypothetical protein
LRIDQVAVYLARMLKGRPNCLRRDLVEGHTMDRIFRRHLAQLVFQMCRDRFAFAVRVGRQIDACGLARKLAQAVHNLHLVRHDDQIRHKGPVVQFDANLVLWQVLDVADRRLDDEVFAQIFSDGFRLCRRFDDDQ